MSPRSLYALILLAVVLAAALQLTGSSQPAQPLPRTVALAPRPVVVVAEAPRPRALDYLRNRPPKREAFVDHYVLMRATIGLASGGVCPLLPEDVGPASPRIGVVVQRELDERFAAAPVEGDSRPIGFEEFTAIVQTPIDVPAFESEEPVIAWQMGCGLDRSTGEVYPQPTEPTFPQLAGEPPSAGQVIFRSLLRVNAPALGDVLFPGRWSGVVRLSELLEFAMRRLALD